MDSEVRNPASVLSSPQQLELTSQHLHGAAEQPPQLRVREEVRDGSLGAGAPEGDLVTCVLGPRLLVTYATASQRNHGKLVIFPTNKEPFEPLEQQFHVHVNVDF